MKKRIFLCILSIFLLAPQVFAEDEVLHWVEFNVDYPALQRALDIDIASQGEEKPLDWIDILALAAVKVGGNGITVKGVNEAAEQLRKDKSPQELLGAQYKYFAYYHRAYEAVLGGLVGSYAIAVTNKETGEQEWVPAYGLKAFSPIAAGYGYSHYSDFGNRRSYGFARRHLGNDLMGALGTPIIAVESGTVEALGWNQYGGWRIGIRSDDRLRYYYYAHLRKDAPYVEGLEVGQHVCAGDVIGFMGRTGYSAKENVNNIDTVHLHFGLQLVFEESQKECDSEIWVDVYDIVRLLSAHRSSVQYDPEKNQWARLYPYRDLDTEPLY
ncbi:MAG: M23 family metallopeptidase [Faecousia sp.]